MPNKDFPFEDVVASAVAQMKKGHFVYQKFTCAGCGQRLTIDQPNIFFETGTCDKCPAVTNIKAQGCNFLVHMVLK
jgi:hypothetical protein